MVPPGFRCQARAEVRKMRIPWGLFFPKLPVACDLRNLDLDLWPAINDSYLLTIHKLK